MSITIELAEKMLIKFDGNKLKGICPDIQILDGVYLCPSLVKTTNNYAITSILNTTEKYVEIENIKINLESVSTESETNVTQILQTSSINTNYSSNRLKEISNSLRTSHLNKEEKESLVKICNHFNHIFYIKGDQLTSTSAVIHEIPTTSSSPVNTKS